MFGWNEEAKSNNLEAMLSSYKTGFIEVLGKLMVLEGKLDSTLKRIEELENRTNSDGK